MYEAISKDSDLHCRWLSKLTIDGRTEKEDIFEVVWTDAEAYRGSARKDGGLFPHPTAIRSPYLRSGRAGPASSIKFATSKPTKSWP